MDINYSQMKKLYDNARKINQERSAIGSKKRLMKSIERRFQTSMIGTLARCEEQFGFLWGYNTNKTLTSDQKQFKILWENLRTDILNHCNSQLRAAMEEMTQYTINWDQYRTEFIIKKDK